METCAHDVWRYVGMNYKNVILIEYLIMLVMMCSTYKSIRDGYTCSVSIYQ